MQPSAGDLAWPMHLLAVAIAEMDTAIAARMNLPAGDYLALKHLAAAGDQLGPAGLGRLLGITSGAATGLVDRLEKAGYVRRGPHPSDRRRQSVSLTPPARERMVSELLPLADDIGRAAAALPPDHRRAVAEVLVSLAELHRRHAH